MSEPLASPDVPVELSDLIQRLKKLPEEKTYVAAYEFVRDIVYGDIGSRSAVMRRLLSKKDKDTGKYS
jgi:hypothetical protein